LKIHGKSWLICYGQIGDCNPILEGIETKNGSYWKIKDFADFLSEKMNGVFRYLKKLF